MLYQATLNVGVCATALAGATAAIIAARTRSAPARVHTFSDMGSLSLSSARWLLLSHAGRWVVVISRLGGTPAQRQARCHSWITGNMRICQSDPVELGYLVSYRPTISASGSQIRNQGAPYP